MNFCSESNTWFINPGQDEKTNAQSAGLRNSVASESGLQQPMCHFQEGGLVVHLV